MLTSKQRKGDTTAATKQERLAANNRRKGNPGTRKTVKTKTVIKAKADPTVQSPTKEPPMGAEDQQRLKIIEQMQEQIVKMASDVPVAADNEIEQLMHGYISSCHNAAMELMQRRATRTAGKVLRQCMEFLKDHIPERANKIVIRKGLMHTIFNNLAQHANMTADMNQSIEYLEKALQAAESPHVEQDLLPLAETYLNLANGYSFLEKYANALEYSEKALKFAKLRCDKLREELADESSKSAVEQNLKVIDNLNFQLQDFIAIMIMSHVACGEQHEKLGSYNAAIKYYSEGTHFAETNFGTKHPLYTKCINAMGGARLKSKYQTKEVYRNVENRSETKPTTVKSSGKSLHARKMSAKKDRQLSARKQDKSDRHQYCSESSGIKSKLMARRMQGSNLSQQACRRDIQAVVKKSEVKMANMMKNHQDNLLFANCDTWTSMHCRHPRPQSRQSLMGSIMRKKVRRSNSRPTSANSFRLPATKGKEHEMQTSVLSSMSDRRAPYKVVCKTGPSCKNHDWNQRSPLKKVCTRGTKCPNHDWDRSLRKSSSISSMRSLKSHQIQLDSSMRQTAPQAPTLPPVDTQSAYTEAKEERSVIEVETKSTGGHSCMLQQTERVHQQQMNQMRTMQDEQFKMIQLVLEAQNKSSQSQGNNQMSQSYMYYPGQQYYAHPQFYNHNYRQQYPPAYYPAAPYPETDDQQETDMSMSDAEQVKEGQKPNQSELSKAEALEDAYNAQQTEMAEMHRRMSKMQSEYNEQINKMRESTERAIADVKRSKAQSQLNDASSQRSIKSDIKPMSQKDFREDDVNERDDVLFGGTEKKRGSQVFDNSTMSRQTLERPADKSILKQSSKFNNNKVGYHESVMEESNRPRRNTSYDSGAHRSPSHKSQSSGYSMKRSFKANSSFITEKSYRMPEHMMKMSREEAAIRIQKMYRGFSKKSDFRMISRKALGQKEPLFSTSISGFRFLHCSMRHVGGAPKRLDFVIKDHNKRSSDQKFSVDLNHLGLTDDSDMTEKVKAIIRNVLGEAHLKQAITAQFNTSEAAEILCREVFSSDDYEQIVQKTTKRESSRDRIVSMEDIAQRSDSNKHLIDTIGRGTENVGYTTEDFDTEPNQADRAKEIKAEIDRIQKKCDLQFRVNINDVVVKNHCTAYDGHKESDQEAFAESVQGADSERVRQITIEKVEVDLKKNGYDSDESLHEYAFDVNPKNITVQRKLSVYRLIKIQAMIRGWLARQYSNRNKIIYRHFLTKDGRTFRFMLRKIPHPENGYPRHIYNLSAVCTTDRNLEGMVDVQELPFQEHEAADVFEDYLVFEYNRFQITELALTGTPAVQVTEVDTTHIPTGHSVGDDSKHLFITNYQPEEAQNAIKKVYQWQLRNKYRCTILDVVKDGQKEFRIDVDYKAKKDYLSLKELPTDIFYLAYFLEKYLNVQHHADDELDYISISNLKVSKSFLKEMKELEVKFFGTTRDQATMSNRSIDFTRVKPIDTKTLETDAPLARDFIVIRNDVKYMVKVYDDTQEKERFMIHVNRQDNPADKDWMSVTQITLFLDEFKKYIKENLQIYTNEAGFIDYLALKNDASIINQSNMRKIREHSAAMRSMTDNASVIRDSSLEGPSVNQSITPGTGSLKRSNTLSQTIDKFKIERNDTTYTVEVNERKGEEGRPIQITVTSIWDKKDSEYIVRKNFSKRGAELHAYLNDHLVVYQRFCDEREKMIIDYVALSQGPLEYNRSNTLSATQQAKPASRQTLMSRANKVSKIRNSNDGVLIAEKYSDATPKNAFTMSHNDEQESHRNMEFSPRIEHQEWKELARESIEVDGRQARALLLEKNQNKRGGRAPLPRGKADLEHYKISIIDAEGDEKIDQVDLSPSACYRLLNLKPDDMDGQHMVMNLQDIMAKSAQVYDRTQMDLMKKQSSFEKNVDGWRIILRHVTYNYIERITQFDVWSICGTKESGNSASPQVVVKQKLNFKPRIQAIHTNETSEKVTIKQVTNMVDGRDEGTLSATMSSGRHVEKKYNIVKKSAHMARMKAMSGQMPLSPNSIATGDEQDAKQVARAVFRGADATYYRMTIESDGTAYTLSLEDMAKKVLAKLIPISDDFIQTHCDGQEDDEKLFTLKKVLQKRISEASNLMAEDGTLNMQAIFDN